MKQVTRAQGRAQQLSLGLNTKIVNITMEQAQEILDNQLPGRPLRGDAVALTFK